MQGPLWHQWQLNGHYKSRVGINDNLLNNLPLCHWWKHSCNNSYFVKIILPLSSSFSPFYSSLPFWHQWQRVPICQSSCDFTVFYSICYILFAPPVIMLCLLPLSSCYVCSPYHHALSALSPPLSLRAKGIPLDVFHILFMIFMWTSIMFSIYFLKYLHQLSHYHNWLSSPSSTSFLIIPQLNSSFLICLFFAFAYDLFWCASLSSSTNCLKPIVMLPLSLCLTFVVMLCSRGPIKYHFLIINEAPLLNHKLLNKLNHMPCSNYPCQDHPINSCQNTCLSSS